MEAFTELYSQLVWQDQSGQKLQRIHMEQQLRDKFPVTLRWSILAIGYGMPQNLALLAPPAFTLHWLLDEMVRREQLEGSIFGLPPDAPLNPNMMQQFTSQLDAAIPAGQALCPQMGEGVEMTKPNVPPSGPSQFPTVPPAAPTIPPAPIMPGAPFQMPQGIPQPMMGVPQMPAGVPQMPTMPQMAPQVGGPPTPVPAPGPPPARATQRRKPPEAPQGVPQMPGAAPQMPGATPQMPGAAPQLPAPFAPHTAAVAPGIDPNQLRQIVREELQGNVVLIEKLLARFEGTEAAINLLVRSTKKLGLVAAVFFRYFWHMPGKNSKVPESTAHLDLEQTLAEIGFKDPQ